MGLDSFIFNLIILGTITTANGNMWRRKPTDLYILEVTETVVAEKLSVVRLLLSYLAEMYLCFSATYLDSDIEAMTNFIIIP